MPCGSFKVYWLLLIAFIRTAKQFCASSSTPILPVLDNQKLTIEQGLVSLSATTEGSQNQYELGVWMKFQPLVNFHAQYNQATSSYSEPVKLKQLIIDFTLLPQAYSHFHFYLEIDDASKTHKLKITYVLRDYYRPDPKVISYKTAEQTFVLEELENEWVFLHTLIHFFYRNYYFVLYRNFIKYTSLEISDAQFIEQRVSFEFFSEKVTFADLTTMNFQKFQGFITKPVFRLVDYPSMPIDISASLKQNCKISDYYNDNLKAALSATLNGQIFYVHRSISISKNNWKIAGWNKVTNAAQGTYEFFGISYRQMTIAKQFQFPFEIEFSYQIGTSASNGFSISLISNQMAESIQEVYTKLQAELQDPIKQWHYFQFQILNENILEFSIAFPSLGDQLTFVYTFKNLIPVHVPSDSNPLPSRLYISIGGYSAGGQLIQAAIQDLYFILNPLKIEFLRRVCHHTCDMCNGPGPEACILCPISRVLNVKRSKCMCAHKALQNPIYECPATPSNWTLEWDMTSFNLDNYNAVSGILYTQLHVQDGIKFIQSSPGGIVSEYAIYCGDCIFSPLTWGSGPLKCTWDYKVYQYQQANNYLKVQRKEDEVEYFSISMEAEEPILIQVFKTILTESGGCLQGYYKTEENTCSRCQESCVLCNKQFECVKCLDSFYLNSSQGCSPCGKNCAICDSFNCLKCLDTEKYFLTLDRQKCEECTLNNCKYCFQYYNSDKLVTSLSFRLLDSIPETATLLIGCAYCLKGSYIRVSDFTCVPPATKGGGVDPLTLQCDQGLVTTSDENQCLIGKFPEATAIQCDAAKIRFCKICLQRAAPYLTPYCVECEAGYQIEIQTGICTPCYQANCSKCLIEHIIAKDSWKWQIVPFFENMVGSYYNSGLEFPPNKYQSACFECKASFQVSNFQCIPWNCQSTYCSNCIVFENALACATCVRQDGSQLGRYLSPSDQGKCLPCIEPGSACSARPVDLDLNLAYIGDRVSDANTFFHFQAEYHIDWSGFLMKCQDNLKCQSEVKVKLNTYCDLKEDQTTLQAAPIIIGETNLLITDLQKEIQYLEAASFVSFLNRMQVKKVLIQILLFPGTATSCQFPMTQIVQSFSKYAYSVTTTSLEILGQSPTVQIDFTPKRFLILNQFNSIKLKNLQFKISQDSGSIPSTLKQLSYLKMDVAFSYQTIILEDIQIYSEIADQQFSLQMFNTSKFEGRNIKVESVKLIDSPLFVINQNQKLPLSCSLENLVIADSFFKNINILEFNTENTLTFTKKLEIQNLEIRNTQLFNSNVVKTTPPAQLSILEFLATNLIISNTLFTNDSSLFYTPCLSNSLIQQVLASQVTIQYNSYLILSNAININNMKIENAVIAYGVLLSNTHLFPKAQSLEQSSAVILNDISLNQISYQTGKAIFNLQQYTLPRLIVSINQLTLNDVHFSNQILNPQILQSYENALIYIVSTTLSLTKTTIERGIGYPEIAIFSKNYITITEFSVSLMQKYFHSFLGIILDCIPTYQLYTFLIYIGSFQNILIEEVKLNNLISIDSPLLLISSVSILELFQNEVVNIRKTQFTNNLMLISNSISRSAILHISSEQNIKISISQIVFRQNHLHFTAQEGRMKSSATLLMQLINGQAIILESVFQLNLVTNSTNSVMYLQAQKVEVSQTNFYANSVLEKALRKQHLVHHEVALFLTIKSSGGSGFFQANTVYIRNILIEQSQGSFGGGFFFQTQEVGIIIIEDIQISNVETTANTLTQSKGGCFYIDAGQSQLKLTMKNIRAETVRARAQGGFLFINPSSISNSIDLRSVVAVDNLAIESGFLSLQCQSVANLKSNLILSNISVSTTEEGFHSFYQYLGQLSDIEIKILQSQNALVMSAYSNFSIENSNFFNHKYQAILDIDQAQEAIIQDLNIAFVSLIQQFLIRIRLPQKMSASLNVERLVVLNASTISLLKSIVPNCQYTTIATPYFEQSCSYTANPVLQAQVNGIKNENAQISSGCLNQIFRFYEQRNLSLVIISGVTNLHKVKFQNNKLERVNCPLCTLGIIYFQISEQLENFKILIRGFQMNYNFCGQNGCLTIITKEFQPEDLMSENQHSRVLMERAFDKFEQYQVSFKYEVLVSESSFLSNQAQYGAGLFVIGTKLLLHSTQMLFNQAQYVGGAIYFISKYNEPLNLIDSILYENQAFAANSIFVSGIDLPNYQSLEVNVMGTSKESIVITQLHENPCALSVSLDGGVTLLEKHISSKSDNLVSEQVSVRPYSILGQKGLQNFIMLPSGQEISSYQYFDPYMLQFIPYNLTLRLTMMNRLNERQKSYNEGKCKLTAQAMSIEGKPVQVSNQGFLSQTEFSYNSTSQDFNLDKLIISFDPYNNEVYLQVKVTCDFLRVPIYDVNPPYLQIGSADYELILKIKTFNCQMGEYYNSEQGTCKLCDVTENQYSVTFWADECRYKNEITMEDIKSSMVKLRPGYWRPYINSLQEESCYHLASNCLGGWVPGDLSCSVGHIGALCEQCDLYNIRGDGSYSNSQKYACGSCALVANNTISIVLISLWTFISIIMSVNSTLQVIETCILGMTIKFLGGSIVLSRTQSGILIKVLTNYLQILGMMSTFSLTIPAGLTSTVDSVGNPVETMAYSLDCYLVQVSNIPILYFRNIWAIMLALSYIVVLLFFYFLGVLIGAIRFNVTFVTTTFIYIYIYLQPNLTSGLISIVSFRNISSINWVQGNVAYLYNTETHYQWMLVFIIPTITMLNIAIPLFLFIWLYKNRLQLWKTYYRRLLGYLYNEYSQNAYFWEIVKILQKQFMIMALTYYEDYVPIKAAAIFLILFFYMIATNSVKPYIMHSLNQMDQHSTIICSTSIVCASTIYTAQANNLIEVVWPLYIIIGVINLYFCIVLVSKILFQQLNAMADVLDKIRLKVRAASPKLQEKSTFWFKLLETDQEKKARLNLRYQKVRDYLRKQAQQIIKLRISKQISDENPDQILAQAMDDINFRNSGIEILGSPKENIVYPEKEALSNDQSQHIKH